MIAQLLVNKTKYSLSNLGGRCFHSTFVEDEIVLLPDFFEYKAFALLAAEVQRMEQNKIRRDLFMLDSGNTPRKMSTIGGLDVVQMSSIIPMLYLDGDLLAFLSGVAGEQVFPVADRVENHVLNFLHEAGDIHGGHIDTYPFAFNIMIEAPPQGVGGLLEMAKRSTRIEDLDNTSMVHSLYIPSGTCYMLRTDRSAHRVSPLIAAGRRTVVNLAYANKDTLDEMSYSSSSLYGP